MSPKRDDWVRMHPVIPFWGVFKRKWAYHPIF
jgi:hypothetical protein